MKKRLIATLLSTLLFCAGTALADTPLKSVYSFNGDPILGEYVEGDVLVLLEAPSKTGAADSATFEAALSTSAHAVASSIGARVVQTYGAIAAASGKSIVYMKSDEKSTQELLASLDGVPGIIGASPNHISRTMLVPNDPSYGELWGMPFISAPSAWDVSIGSRQVFVGIIDTGIDYNHPDLAGNIGRDMDNNIGRDTVAGDNDPAPSGWHGSHVAGTIGAVGNNGTGVVGVNWEVGLLAVQVFSPDELAYDNHVIAGLNYLLAQKQRGLNIRAVNMSIGGWRDPILNPAADPYGSAIKALSDAGVIIVIAAGNEGQDIDNPTGYMHPTLGWIDLRGQLCYPACFQFDNTITVASITSTGVRSSFSNYSPNYVHLAAPGSGIFSTIPGGTYNYSDGTSMAAPHVAGAVALLAAAHPMENAAQIKARILNNVNPNANLNGLVARNGHLNVNAAIRGVGPTPTPDPDIRVTGVTVAPTSLNLAIGQNFTLNATVIPANAADKTVTWTTSNAAVVDGTVSGLTATVTAYSAGTAVVTVRTNDGGFTATCTITVGSGGGGGSGGGCSVGAGVAIPAVLLLMIPLAMLLKRGTK